MEHESRLIDTNQQMKATINQTPAIEHRAKQRRASSERAEALAPGLFGRNTNLLERRPVRGILSNSKRGEQELFVILLSLQFTEVRAPHDV